MTRIFHWICTQSGLMKNGKKWWSIPTICGWIQHQLDSPTLDIVYSHTHRSLNSHSHRRFCNRDFACGPYILDCGKSKKDCLNSCRNRSAHHQIPWRDSNPGHLGEHLRDWKWSRLYIIDFREIYLIKHSKYFIVRSF